jgi:diadenylate cyclase
LTTIFTPYSPLHDGAVIVRGDTVIGAGCILPLSQAHISDRTLGTRHRAALGLAEETDAIVLVVSEETATISVAVDGRLARSVSPARIRELLANGQVGEARDVALPGLGADG